MASPAGGLIGRMGVLRQPDNTMLFDYALNPAQIRLLYAQRNERPQ
jgi:hypothetical protein